MTRKEYLLLLFLTMLAGMVGGAMSGRFFASDPALAQQRTKVINAEEFLLVDKNGRTRAGLGLDANGEVGLVLLDKAGTKSLHLSPDERLVLRLTDKDGKVLWSAP